MGKSLTSSNISLLAASSFSSPASTPPAGTIHWSGELLLVINKTCFNYERKSNKIGSVMQRFVHDKHATRPPPAPFPDPLPGFWYQWTNVYVKSNSTKRIQPLVSFKQFSQCNYCFIKDPSMALNSLPAVIPSSTFVQKMSSQKNYTCFMIITQIFETWHTTCLSIILITLARFAFNPH